MPSLPEVFCRSLSLFQQGLREESEFLLWRTSGHRAATSRLSPYSVWLRATRRLATTAS